MELKWNEINFYRSVLVQSLLNHARGTGLPFWLVWCHYQRVEITLLRPDNLVGNTSFFFSEVIHSFIIRMRWVSHFCDPYWYVILPSIDFAGICVGSALIALGNPRKLSFEPISKTEGKNSKLRKSVPSQSLSTCIWWPLFLSSHLKESGPWQFRWAPPPYSPSPKRTPGRKNQNISSLNLYSSEKSFQLNYLFNMLENVFPNGKA